MSKIVAVIGSPKPMELSKTHTLVNNFIASLKSVNSEIDATIISLSESKIQQCKGCMTCKKNGQCVINDDMNNLKDILFNSDMLILASPVHFRHISSIFQNFIERLLVDLHTFEYLGKPFVNIITTNGSGEEDADKYLTKIGYLLGAIKIGKICKSENDKFNTHNFNKIVSIANDILVHKKIVKPRLMNKLYFSSMKKIIKENASFFEYERIIWNERNWFNKNYSAIFREKNL